MKSKKTTVDKKILPKLKKTLETLQYTIYNNEKQEPISELVQNMEHKIPIS